MRKLKKQNAITLVALVITIVILLILAGISISALTNTGIFAKAKEAKSTSENAEKEQSQTLSEYEKELNKYIAKELTDDKINTVLRKTENTILKDANGNIFTLPAGFKVVVNDDTNNAKTVDKGIVIEDVTDATTKGSQFVWVPVGVVKRDNGVKNEIKLNRYIFEEDGTPIEQGEKIIGDTQQEMESTNEENIVSKSLSKFKTSVNKNNGFYIGRYEARKASDGKVTEIGTDNVWNSLYQSKAAQLSQNMYNNSLFTSDLINSYAWDTAVLFLQNCGSNDSYSRQKSKNTGELALKGTNNLEMKDSVDLQCNVYDMASNMLEWTTEMTNHKDKPCVTRGSCYVYDYRYTSYRDVSEILRTNAFIGFRPIIYIND